MPIAVGLGEGSDLRRPLGIALIGGLLISQSLPCSARRRCM
jgi:multidrug efflux pump